MKIAERAPASAASFKPKARLWQPEVAVLRGGAETATVMETAESDLYTTAKWDELGVDSRIFDLTPGATDLAIGHFQVLATGPRIGETWDCLRAPDPLVFADGFEVDGTGRWSETIPPL